MSSFSLHEWLQSEQAAGTLDSEGEFTIAQSKAWEKLGAFQLPFPEAWVLKLVQAALAWGKSRVAVVQTREETRFDLFNVPDWAPTELERAIFDTQHKAEGSLNHLAVAVRALALQRTRPFSLRYADGSQVAWNGSAFTPLDPDDAKPGVFTLTVTNYRADESKLFFSTGHGNAARFRVQVSKALTDHCHLSGDRITLDTRPLISYWTDPDFGKTESSHPLTVVKAAPLAEWKPMVVEGHFMSPLAKFTEKNVEMMMPPGISSRNTFSTAAILSFFCRNELVRESLQLDKWLYHPLNKRSQVLWYSDGVIVSREPLSFDSTVGLGVIVSAEGLPTDLTGFTPLKGPEKEARVARSLAALRPELSRLQEAVGEAPFAVTGQRVPTVVSGLIGAGVAFALPVLGVPWVLASGYKIAKGIKENSSLETAYNDAFTELVDHFSTRDVTVL
ncbi:MAG: hypothetical protein WC314_13220 [Vulcanimicrobiota bacterium]